MPLETGTFISDLVPTNPVHTDQMNQEDGHVRLVKASLKNTFPNITGAINSSQTQIDAAVAATTGTAALLMNPSGGVEVAGDTTTKIYSPGTGQLTIATEGHDALKVRNDQSVEMMGNATVDGNLNIQGSLTVGGGGAFPGAIPVGGTMVWWSDTLPSASYGTYAWCNGGTFLRTQPLFGVIGTSQGTGDGATTANLPDLREAVPVGKSTMGATTARGLITQFTTSAISTLGSLFGEAMHLLGIGEMPAHDHTLHDPGHAHNYTFTGLGGGASITNNGSTENLSFSTQATSSATTGITIDPIGGGASHNNVQPSTVCNWIIRVA
jgi:microcystin-dependent protein